MRSLLALIRRIDQIPILIASAALFILMVMTFCDVILRSSFNAPIEAATELTRILVAITVFAVLPHVSASSGHISVDLTDPFFQRFHLDRWRDGIIFVVCGGLLYWPTQRIITLADRTRGYGDVTEYLGIPQHYIMWFIAIATATAGIAMVVSGLLRLIAPDLLRARDQ
ncbi:MAG: TRAP transporter small permease subunit [Rhodobacter sp.]|nr:TRAP transporter small permease subunit [Rhodobacter sp.]